MRSSSGVQEGADDGFSEIEIESRQEDRLLEEEQQHQAASAQGQVFTDTREHMHAPCRMGLPRMNQPW